MNGRPREEHFQDPSSPLGGRIHRDSYVFVCRYQLGVWNSCRVVPSWLLRWIKHKAMSVGNCIPPFPSIQRVLSSAEKKINATGDECLSIKVKLLV
jgi:hypothetical protein